MSAEFRRLLRVAWLGAAALTVATPALAAEALALEGVWWARAPAARLLPMDGRPLPFTAAGRARYEQTMAELKSGALVDDATYLCRAQGTPRALTSAYPMQIVLTPGQVTFLYEENRFFRVVNESQQHADPDEWDPSFMGDGIAQWSDLRELVIDTRNFKADGMYLDATGVPVSDQLQLTERMRLKNNGRELEVLITIDDSEMFTRPWTARRTFARRDDVDLRTDWVCGESHRNLAAAMREVRGRPGRWAVLAHTGDAVLPSASSRHGPQCAEQLWLRDTRHAAVRRHIG